MKQLTDLLPKPQTPGGDKPDGLDEFIGKRND
jgi:hypothetical protein